MDYKNIALGVFQVQNQVRKNPQSLIPKLEEMLKYFQGSLYKKPGEIPLQTNEGPNAVMECINALRSTAPVGELTLSDGLVKACTDHVNDIGPNGACSHSGSDGSTFTDRIERYGEWMGNIAENCEFGSCNPEEVIINLLVDDGCSNRGHRKNILNPKYRVVGVASGAHKGVRHCTVLDYASEYTPKGQGVWNNPPSAFGDNMGVSFGAKPAYTTNYTQPTTNYTQPSNPTTNYTQPTSYTNNFSTPTSNFGYGGNSQGTFGIPMTVSTAYTPHQEPQQQAQYAPSQSQYQPQYAPTQSQYQPQPQQYQPQPQAQPTSYTSYTTGPSSYTAPTSYTTQPTYTQGQGHGTPSFSQRPQTDAYSTPSYSQPTSNYSNPNPNQSPYTQTTQNVTQGPDGYKQTTTTTSYSSSNNSWGSNPRDDFGFPQSTFQTKQFGDKDLLKDPFISEHLAKMKLTTDSSSTNLRDMAQKEAPPGANGWSINSTIEIRNGQKYTRVVTTYSFPDGSKRDVIKEFMEGGL